MAIAHLRPASRRLLASTSASASAVSSRRNASTLLFLEHRAGRLNPGVFTALTAARQLGGDVAGVLIGADGDGGAEAVDEAKKLNLDRIIQHTAPALEHSLAEPLAPLLAALVKDGSFTHLVAAHTAQGKNVFPRVAALLDVAQVSDVMKIEGEDTFVRPFYAGNAIATVKATDAIKVLTIRSSAFEPAKADGGDAKVEKGESGKEGKSMAEWVSEALTKSERPDLGSAARVVSGGRGVKNKENFDSVVIPLADALGAAVGASRAAVDSGFADNSLQVGQTGKVVAPELYLAVGISGAIQHLAGMKDSKLIACINKDAEAPIFQVADLGLVGDLFEAAPKLTELLGKK